MSLKRLDLSEKIFSILNAVLLMVFALVAIYPIWYIFISAFSDPVIFSQQLYEQPVILWPQGFTAKYFLEHILNHDIWRAYGNTLYYTVFGTFISMVLSVLAAYVLSHKKFMGLTTFTVIIVLSIWVNPGMIATFLNIDGLGLTGSSWGVLLPFAFSGYNVILLRTAFATVPSDLIESAEIDGAGHIRKLFNVVLPSTMPAVVSITLFYAIARWNGFFWAEIVLLDDKLYPVQVILKKLLEQGGDSASLFEGAVSAYALIVIVLLPVILLFPLLNSVFKKGILSGAIK